MKRLVHPGLGMGLVRRHDWALTWPSVVSIVNEFVRVFCFLASIAVAAWHTALAFDSEVLVRIIVY